MVNVSTKMALLMLVLINLCGLSTVLAFPSELLNPYIPTPTQFAPHAGRGSGIFSPHGAKTGNGFFNVPGTGRGSGIYNVPDYGTQGGSSNRVILMLLKEQCLRLVQEGGTQTLPDYCYYVLGNGYLTGGQVSYLYLQALGTSVKD